MMNPGSEGMETSFLPQLTISTHSKDNDDKDCAQYMLNFFPMKGGISDTLS
jgi:hypothetical protein